MTHGQVPDLAWCGLATCAAMPLAQRLKQPNFMAGIRQHPAEMETVGSRFSVQDFNGVYGFCAFLF